MNAVLLSWAFVALALLVMFVSVWGLREGLRLWAFTVASGSLLGYTARQL